MHHGRGGASPEAARALTGSWARSPRMAQDNDSPPTNREKQKAHSAQRGQGDQASKDPGSRPSPRLTEGPEEKNQQRRYE